jgi:hypothetical protein
MSSIDDLNVPNAIDDLNISNAIDDLNNSTNIIDDINNQQLFITTGSIPYVPLVFPIAPICFIAGSKVVTDQGVIEIENINEAKHTIRNKKIVALTKTKLCQNYLVQIEKDALYKNVPNARTTVSLDHKIFYFGKMVAAKELVNKVEGINKIQYNNETLYNILLETHDKMIVNNLISETLSPGNIIAILYNSKLSQKKKNNIIVELNEAIKKNDIETYIKIGKRLSKK